MLMASARFNRYIVECSVRLFDDRKARFNRYIVECKYDGVDPNSIEEVDLIDT